MAWAERLQGHATFISPSGESFEPLWRGNEISGEKRLGRFAYPNVDREVTQDLGMNSRDIPLTVYWAGKDHDIRAAEFERALHEPGRWSVKHPVYGGMRLQLVSYKFDANPVESGNVTVFETEWIEPADDGEIISFPDPVAAVEAAIAEVNKATLWDTYKIGRDFIMRVLNAITGFIRGIDEKITAVREMITGPLDILYNDVSAIAGTIIEIVQAPGFILDSVHTNIAVATSKIVRFADLGHQFIADAKGSYEYSKDRVKSALSGQLFLNAIQAGMAGSIIATKFETRREALITLNEYLEFARAAQASLDYMAEKTAQNNIEDQFTARATSGEAIATLDAAVSRYLMNELFNLKIERRITLDRPRAPMEIVVTELGADANTADGLYDSFCAWNGLHGLELLLLPTGREVVLYG